MTLPKPDFTGDPEEEGGGSRNGNGNRLRDYRLDRVEDTANKATEKVDDLGSSVAVIQETLNHVPTKAYILTVILTVGIPTLIGVIAIIVRLFK